MVKLARIVNVRDIGRACAEEVQDTVFRTIEIKGRRTVSGDILDHSSYLKGPNDARREGRYRYWRGKVTKWGMLTETGEEI